MRRRSILLTLVAALAAAPAAAAQSPWTVPAAVEGVTGFYPTFAGFGPSGAGAIVWEQGEDTDVAWIGADGSVGPRATLVAGEHANGMCFPRGDEFLLLGEPVREGRVGVGVERERPPTEGVLFCDEYGHVRSVSPRRIYGRRRIAGAAITMAPDGRLLAVWSRRGRVFARLMGRDGRLGKVQRIGRTGREPHFKLAMARDGSAAIVWTTQVVHEGEPFTSWRAQIALARPGTRFGRQAHLLSVIPPGTGAGDNYVGDPGAVVAMTPDGRGAVAWQARLDPRREPEGVQAASIDHGRLGPAQWLTPDGFRGGIEALAAGAAGEVLALWSGGDFPRTYGAFASVRRADQPRFDAAEQIYQGTSVNYLALADIDAVSGRMIAAFDTGHPDAAPWRYAFRTPAR